MLSFTVLFRHHTTVWACPGSVGRRYTHKTNTVLLSFFLDPVEYLPVCPWSHGFPKKSTSVFSLSPFHVTKFLDTKNLNVSPGKFIKYLIYIVSSFFISSFTGFRTRFSSKNFISNFLETRPKKFSCRINNEFIDSKVDPKCFTLCFTLCIRTCHPDRTSILGKTDSLYKLSFRHSEPFINRFSLSGRDSYFMPFFKTTKLQNEIKGFISLFYRNELSIQNSRTCVNRERAGFTKSFSRLFCAGNYFKSLFKCLRFISLRQSCILETNQSFFIQLSWMIPEGFDVEILL